MPESTRAERVTWVDWAMVALAAISLLILVVEQAFSEFITPQQRIWIIVADLAIVAVFAAEFLIRMRGVPDKVAYAKSRWYDILGMVPVSHPFFRGFRLLRLLRILVITSRFVRATNRSFGEMAFEATVVRFRNVLVENITDAIVLNSLTILEPALTRARFAERIGDVVDERRAEIRTLIRQNIQNTPGGKALLSMPAAETILRQAEEAALTAVVETLRSEELNAVLQDATRNVLKELRTEIARKDYTLRGGPPGAAAG